MDSNHLTMRQSITKLGRTKVVVITTIVTLFLALICTLGLEFYLHQIGINVHPVAAVFITSLTALIITPIMSWHFVSLIIIINQLEGEMRALATYDSLTGLLSRREFIERAEHYFKVAKREGHEFSLIIVDIDDFKNVNDQYGHIAGDKTLESFGESVRSTLRESDLASRFGGDEFVFFLPNTTSEQARIFTRRLYSKIREVVEVDNLRINYTASMGLVTYPEVAVEHIDEIISAADKALYRAKNNGGNQTQVFAAAQTKKDRNHLSFSNPNINEDLVEHNISKRMSRLSEQPKFIQDTYPSFHYLDMLRSLLTSFGEVNLPEPTPVPAHLRGIKYNPPD